MTDKLDEQEVKTFGHQIGHPFSQTASMQFVRDFTHRGGNDDLGTRRRLDAGWAVVLCGGSSTCKALTGETENRN